MRGAIFIVINSWHISLNAYGTFNLAKEVRLLHILHWWIFLLLLNKANIPHCLQEWTTNLSEESYKNGYSDGYNNIKYEIKNNDPSGYDDGYGEGKGEQEGGDVVFKKIKKKTKKKNN